MALDADLRDLVGQRASTMHIKAAAERKGMVSLKHAGEHLARAGITTLEEVARVIESVEELL